MNNERKIENFIKNLDNPFLLYELVILFHEKGGTDDSLLLNTLERLIDEKEVYYERLNDKAQEKFGYAYITNKYISKNVTNRLTR